MSDKIYDLVVLGCGPAGEKAALAGKKLGKSVALIEPQFIGGLCAHTGTVPTKSFREAVVQLTNFRERFMEFGILDRPRMEDLKLRVDWVRGKKVEAIGKRLNRRGVDIVPGWACFHTPHELGVYNDGRKLLRTIAAENVVIATGTVPYLRPEVEFDGKRIFYTDNVLQIPEVPQTMTVVGGGIIGTELASMFAVIGTQVNLIDRRETFLPFLNKSVHRKLMDNFSERRMKFTFEDEVDSAVVTSAGVHTELKSGNSIDSEMALFCEFRQVATESLNLDEVGIRVNERGVIEVDADYRTNVENIFAAGDVIGSPALASTSFEQGRIAGNIASGNRVSWTTALAVPVAIYCIPEVAFVGFTEQELKEKEIAFVKGTSLYRESARGAILGTLDGMAEMLVAPEDGRVLGVHIIGDQASELVHVAQAVMKLEGTYEYFIESVFNYPTLAEMLKYAAISLRDKL